MSGEPPWAAHEFVFVAGMHRSGTTLLADVIGSAGASGLTGTGVRMDEGQFLQDVYPIGRVFGGPTRWALDDRAYLTEQDAAAVPGAAERLWGSWSPHWNLEAEYLVEKTPLNLTKTRFLQAIFPRSKFVVITRHPITQALAVRKWSNSMPRKFGFDFPSVVEMWLRAHEAFRRDSAHLNSFHVVRFEDMIATPQRVLDELQDFLGFPVVGDALLALDGKRANEYVADWQQVVREGGVQAAVATLARTSIRRRSQVRASLRRALEQTLFPRYDQQMRRNLAGRAAALGYDLAQLDRADRWL